jgi:hypothetical protein
MIMLKIANAAAPAPYVAPVTGVAVTDRYEGAIYTSDPGLGPGWFVTERDVLSYAKDANKTVKCDIAANC